MLRIPPEQRVPEIDLLACRVVEGFAPPDFCPDGASKMANTLLCAAVGYAPSDGPEAETIVGLFDEADLEVEIRYNPPILHEPINVSGVDPTAQYFTAFFTLSGTRTAVQYISDNRTPYAGIEFERGAAENVWLPRALQKYGPGQSLPLEPETLPSADSLAVYGPGEDEGWDNPLTQTATFLSRASRFVELQVDRHAPPARPSRLFVVKASRPGTAKPIYRTPPHAH